MPEIVIYLWTYISYFPNQMAKKIIIHITYNNFHSLPGKLVHGLIGKHIIIKAEI